MPLPSGTDPDVSQSFLTCGRIVTPGTPLQITTRHIPLGNGAMILAHKDNTKRIFVGAAADMTQDAFDDNTDFADGFPLEAGQSIIVTVDKLNSVWVQAEDPVGEDDPEDQKFYVLAT